MLGLFFTLLFGAMGCQIGKKQSDLPNLGPYRVVGYVKSRGDMHRVNARLLTHINYAFAKLDEQGELVFNNPEQVEQDLAQLQVLREKNPKIKVLLSVGGWGADHFSDAALTPASRRRMAQSIVEHISKYNLNGVDLDWEYPGQPGPGIKYRPEDRENFTFLLKTVREYLNGLSEQTGQAYLLTIAAPGSKRYFENTEMDVLHQYLDFINVMSYDFYTAGSGVTGHHTGLRKSEGARSSSRNAEAAVALHLEAGIPPHKIVLGAAFYGRGWTGVHPENSGLHQEYERFTKAYTYKELKANYIGKRGFDRYWDRDAQAPYLWQADSTTFISYEDPESLKHKASFVKKQSLGGVMFWEYSQDAEGVLLDTLVKALEHVE